MDGWITKGLNLKSAKWFPQFFTVLIRQIKMFDILVETNCR